MPYFSAGSSHNRFSVIFRNIASARKGREIYVTGHMEYDPLTLDREYRRDIGRGLPMAIPKNYYPGDDPSRPPVVRWQAHTHLFFSNRLNYVYQETPYDLGNWNEPPRSRKDGVSVKVTSFTGW